MNFGFQKHIAPHLSTIGSWRPLPIIQSNSLSCSPWKLPLLLPSLLPEVVLRRFTRGHAEFSNYNAASATLCA